MPVSRYSEDEGMDEESDCIVCARGTYVDETGSDNDNDCKACATGKWTCDHGRSCILRLSYI